MLAQKPIPLFSALQNAIIIGALPFAVIVVLMMGALGKAIYRDGLREKENTEE